MRRAASTVQLGALAYARFRESLQAPAPSEVPARHLDDAFTLYRQALRLYPANASAELAVIHNMIGLMFMDITYYDSALEHFQQAIQHQERLGDHYGAGNSRYNAALAHSRARRRDRALLYARAGLRDYESVGPGAAEKADRQRRLIADLEQGRPV